MKNKKLLIIIIIVVVIFMLLFISVLVSRYKYNKNYEYNKTYIKNYVAEKYSDYIIIGKRYETPDNFYSTYREIEKDYFSNNITCYVSLVNKKTKMKITIPFFHPAKGKYTDSQYGRKNIKNMVNEYTNYYNLIQKNSEKYNVEIKVADAELSETSNSDIYDLTIYIRNNNKENIEKFINETKSVNTNLYINNIIYIVANDDIYKILDPYTESNVYDIEDIVEEKMNAKVKYVKEEDDYDFYMVEYEVEDNYRSKFNHYYKLEK